MNKVKFLFALTTLLFQFVGATGEKRIVTAEGTGATKREATANAVVEATKQLYGVAISQTQRDDIRTRILDAEKKSAFHSETQSTSLLIGKTRGRVFYDIVTDRARGSSHWVRIKAWQAKNSLKSFAVPPFTTAAQFYPCASTVIDATTLGKIAAQALEHDLIENGKKTDISVIRTESAISVQSDRSDTKNAIRTLLAEGIDVDCLISGSITTFSVQRIGRNVSYSFSMRYQVLDSLDNQIHASGRIDREGNFESSSSATALAEHTLRIGTAEAAQKILAAMGKAIIPEPSAAEPPAQDHNQGIAYFSAGNYEAAIPLLRAGAAKDDAESQNLLGFCYENGYGVGQNQQEAIRLYKLSAAQNHATAQNNLGMCYFNGKGIAKNYTEAARLFTLGANQGHATAQNNLGFCYENGYGIGQNQQEAIRLYRLSVDQGDTAAQCNLGMCYLNGKGVAKNHAEAARLFTLSANQGYATAQNNLGSCYENGYGIGQNQQEAIRLYRLSADQGNALAQSNLGMCYFNGKGVAKNHTEAVRLFTLSANQGDQFGQNNLGSCYENGYGIGQNQQEAIRLYRLSADQGNAMAQSSLGMCYFNGKGVAKNHTEAARLFTLSANQGHATAQNNLGFCYENGYGVRKNKDIAKSWYEKSAAQGCAQAVEALKRLNSWRLF